MTFFQRGGAILLVLFSATTVFGSAKITGFHMVTCEKHKYCLTINSNVAYQSSFGSQFSFDKAEFTVHWLKTGRTQQLSGDDVFFDEMTQLILIRSLDSRAHRQAAIDLKKGRVEYFD